MAKDALQQDDSKTARPWGHWPGADELLIPSYLDLKNAPQIQGFNSGLQLRSGFRVDLMGHPACGRVLSTTYEVNHGPICFWFCLSGGGRSISGREQAEVRPEQCAVFWLGDAQGKVEQKAGENFLGVSLHVQPAWLAQYLGRGNLNLPAEMEALLNRGHGRSFSYQSSISPACQLALHQLVFERPRHAPWLMYVESKALELLALRLGELSRRPGARTMTLAGRDVERIRQAREILLKKMQNPPTLHELARKVGINEFKLKQGFRQVFNNTAYGCLNEHRMTLARSMICQGKSNVSETAWEVGYTNVSHFIAAYRKYYGYNPGKELRARTCPANDATF